MRRLTALLVLALVAMLPGIDAVGESGNNPEPN